MVAEKRPRPAQREPADTSLGLDPVDRGIIAMLQKNGRLSNSAIARELGADRAAVVRHGLLELCRQHPELLGEPDGR